MRLRLLVSAWAKMVASQSRWMARAALRVLAPSKAAEVSVWAQEPLVAAGRVDAVMSPTHTDTTARKDEAGSLGVWIVAAGLPGRMARPDGRGGVVELRELVKRWACSPEQRQAMIAAAPRRHRRLDRFTKRRWDLARVAAVVHALCDRDGVPVPGWVWKHRASRPVGITPLMDPRSRWAQRVLADAPEACAYHNVWFDPSMIASASTNSAAGHDGI